MKKDIIEKLFEKNPEALLLEPRELYDRALVGITDNPQDDWDREKRVWVAEYDATLCVMALVTEEGWTWEDSSEWFSYNTSSAWLGESTPTFRYADLGDDITEEIIF